jgi:hypothetical protein
VGRFFLIAVVEVDDCAWRDLIRVHQLLYTSFRSSTQVVERGPCIYPERRSSQRSRGAKLLHLSWEMRAGRATRVSRAGLARLISWRMNSARVDCSSGDYVVRLVSTGLAQNPHASGEAATTPESTNLRSNQPTGCVLLHEGYGKSYSRAENVQASAER